MASSCTPSDLKHHKRSWHAKFSTEYAYVIQETQLALLLHTQQRESRNKLVKPLRPGSAVNAVTLVQINDHPACARRLMTADCLAWEEVSPTALSHSFQQTSLPQAMARSPLLATTPARMGSLPATLPDLRQHPLNHTTHRPATWGMPSRHPNSPIPSLRPSPRAGTVLLGLSAADQGLRAAA